MLRTKKKKRAKARNNVLNGILTFLIWVFVIGLIGYAVGILLVINFQHTYFDPTSPLGKLVSERFVTLQWWTLFVSALLVFIPVFVLLMRVDKWLGLPGWVMFWNIMLALFVAGSVFAVASLGNDRSHANQQNQKHNKFNSLFWCCIPEIYNNVANGCPPGPCTATDPPVILPTTIDELKRDRLAEASFWFNIGFMVLGFAMLIISIIINFYEPEYYPVLSNVKRKKKTDEEKNTEEVESKMKYPASNSTRKRQISGVGVMDQLVVPVTEVIVKNTGKPGSIKDE